MRPKGATLRPNVEPNGVRHAPLGVAAAARSSGTARLDRLACGLSALAHPSLETAPVDRDALLGLCAALNVAQAMLDEAGLREAGAHVNAAVVAVHRDARWAADELARMAEAQAWVVAQLGHAMSA